MGKIRLPICLVEKVPVCSKRTLEVVHVLVHVLERVIHVPTHHPRGRPGEVVRGLDALRQPLHVVDEDGVFDAAAICKRRCLLTFSKN